MILQFFSRFFFSGRAVSVVRSISILSWVGIAVGMFAMIVVMSVMTGFGDGIQRRILNVDAHFHLLDLDSSSIAQVNSFLGSGEVNPNSQGLEKPKRGHLSPYENQDVFIRTVDELSSGAQARGLLQEELRALGTRIGKTQQEANGSHAMGEEFQDLGVNEVILGVDLARLLGVFEGEELTLVPPEALLLPPGEAPPFQKVTVKRLLRSNVADFDSQTLFYVVGNGSLKNLSRSASLQKGYAIRLLDPAFQQETENFLKSKGIKFETWEQRNSSLFYSLHMEKFLMGLFLSLTLLVASFSIVVVLSLLAVQKRMDIGILLAMGLSPNNVVKMFTLLGMTMASFGIFLGAGAGTLFCIVWAKYPIIRLPDIYYDTRIPVRLDVNLTVAVILTGFFVAAVASYATSRRLSRLQPVEALRNQTGTLNSRSV